MLESGLPRAHAIEISVRSSHPEGSGAILDDGPDPVIRESFVARVVDDALALQAVESPVRRSDPDAAVAILVEREDPVGRQTRRGGIARESAVAESIEAVSGADPDRALPIAPEHARQGGGQSLLGGVEPGLAIADVNEAASGADPETSSAVSHDRERRSGKAVLERPHLDAAGGKTRETVRQAEPEVSHLILVERSGALGRKSVLRRENFELSIADPRDAGARTDPERAVARLDQGPDERALEPCSFAECFEAPFAAAREPGQGADPQSA